MAVILETSLGDLTVDLYTDERPRCCKNFLKLCKVKYYNFCLFHSVQRNLVAQTGDPTGTGRGGESVYTKIYGEQAKYFDAELAPRIKHSKSGLVSMVNNGNNMHGSQFFITLAENLDYLDGKHTVFGEIAEGEDVLMKINEAYCDEEHRPYKDIRIYHTVILDDPYDDPDGLEVPDRSPEPTKEQLDSVRIGADEEIDDFQGKTEEEVREFMEEKDQKSNAQILEILGDIPDVDVKPPDTILFVCKLNPVTTDEDLEIIFSRFGTILSCEVIKDHKTDESLQYAFVEFEKPEDCESAYFKMDNVLIDDRRIHVDFSQSVTKFKWKGKGKGVIRENENEEQKSKYEIRDRSTRQDNNYELMFEDGGSTKPKKSKKKKKHKERQRSGSDSDSGSRQRKHRERRSGSDSDSGYRRKKHKEHKHKSRSRSPVSRYKRDRSPPQKYSKHRDDYDSRRYSDRDRSRDEDRYDRSRKYDRHRESEGSKYRDRR